MNKFRFSLLLLPLLVATACSPKAKEPSFKKYSNKVDYETFTADMDSVTKSLLGDLEGTNLPSFVATSDSYINAKQTTTNEQHKYTCVEEQSLRNVIKTQYDKDNKIVTVDNQVDNTNSRKNTGFSKENDSVTSNKSISLQFEEKAIDGENSIAAIDKGNKAYYNCGPIVNEGENIFNLQSIAAMAGGKSATFYLLFYMQYAFSSEEEQAKYAFYSDDKVFTMTYATELKDEENVPDSEDIAYESIKKVDDIVQFVYSKNKVTIASKFIEEETTTYSADYSGQKKGDVVVKKSTMYSTSNMEYKKIKLKSIDTSKFTLLDDNSVLNELFE